MTISRASRHREAPSFRRWLTGFPSLLDRRQTLASLLCTLATVLAPLGVRKASAMGFDTQETLRLPEPRLEGVRSVESALQLRRSVRAFSREALTLSEVAQILWAAQGISDWRAERFRTAPSAGALYPLQVLLMAGRVDDLAPGIYRYLPEEHALALQAKGDQRAALAKAALAQDWIAGAACVLALTGIYARTTGKYGERGRRYVHMEVGHVAQNVYLQAGALGLGTTMVGAFRDQELQLVLGLETDESPLALLPVGRLG